jgi:hypothetical protein
MGSGGWGVEVYDIERVKTHWEMVGKAFQFTRASLFLDFFSC